MKARVLFGSTVAALAAVFGVAPAGAGAAPAVYVSGKVSAELAALGIGSGGALAAVAGSPFSTQAGPEGLALSPDGRRLYLAERNAPRLGVYAVGADGSVASAGGASAVSSPVAVSATADGRFVYAADTGSDGIDAFAVAGDGSLNAIPGSPFATGNNPVALASTPNGRFLFVVNPTDNTMSRLAIAPDGSLSSLGPVTPVGAGSFGVAITPDGRFLYVPSFNNENVRGFAIGDDGSLTSLGASFPAPGADATGIAISPDGRFLYVPSSDARVFGFAIDAAGALTPVAGSPVDTGADAWGIGVSPDSRALYVATRSGATAPVAAFRVGGDGSLAPIAGSPFATDVDMGAGTNFQSLAVAPDQPPVASFSAAAAPPGEPTSFDASASTDPDGAIARYDWDFGDGTMLADGGPNPAHAYSAEGTYEVTLTLTDDAGCSTSRTYTGQTVSCNGGPGARTQREVAIAAEPPPADATAPAIGASGKRRQKLGKFVVIRVSSDEDASATAGGRLVVRRPSGRGKDARKARRFKLASQTRSIAAQGSARFKLRLPRKGQRAARSALRRRGRVIAKIGVSATDAAGNEATAARKVRLVR